MEMSVTLGNVLTIVAMVAALWTAYAKLKERLIAIETQLRPLWDEYTDRRSNARPRRTFDRDHGSS